MMTKALGVFLLLVAVQNICSAQSIFDGLLGSDVIATPTLVFSDPNSGVKLKGHYSRETIDNNDIQKFEYKGVGCNCHESTCECCVSVDVAWFPTFKGCVLLLYIPSDTSLKVAVTLNKAEVISKTFSLKDPIRLCANIPYIPGGKVCASVDNIKIQDAALDACVYLEVQIFGTIVFNMKFDCIHILSPEATDQLPMLPEINPQLDHHLNLTTVKPAGQ